MARSFDGVDDFISWTGLSSATTAGVTVCVWINPTSFGENSRGRIVNNAQYQFMINNFDATNTLNGAASHATPSGSAERFAANSLVSSGAMQFVAMVWNGGKTGSTAFKFYIATASGAVAEMTYNDALASTATGTLVAAIGTAYIGNTSAGDRTFTGLIGFLSVFYSQLTLAQINIVKNYGVIGGAQMYVPMTTADIANKGNGGGTPTVSGPTVASLPRVERMYAGMMGVGR